MRTSVIRRVGREIAFVGVLTVLLSALGFAVVWATTVRVGSSSLLIDLSVSDLAQTATVVAEGVVVDQRTRSPREGIGVLTDSTVRISRVLKGVASETLVVTSRGGRLGNVLEVAEDDPSLRAGQRLVLFLAPRWDGGLEVVGGFQGRYHIEADRAQNEKGTVPISDLVDAIARAQGDAP